jgi:hypothetical protein
METKVALIFSAAKKKHFYFYFCGVKNVERWGLGLGGGGRGRNEILQLQFGIPTLLLFLTPTVVSVSFPSRFHSFHTI